MGDAVARSRARRDLVRRAEWDRDTCQHRTTGVHCDCWLSNEGPCCWCGDNPRMVEG